MENKNYFMNVAYKLYDATDGKAELIEETTDNTPFLFVSGLNFTLDAFEEQVVGLNVDDEFDFVLTPEQAYGEYVAERVISLEKAIFERDGKFDEENIYIDAIIPLQNEDGNRFMARVMEIGDDSVTVDLNHPLAGRTLNFQGKILEKQEATNEQVQQLVNQMHGGGCSGGCSSCGGNCGEGGCGGNCGGDCNCGN